MSTSEAAVDRGNDAEDDCPLCLEPLPPFWDADRRVVSTCCAKDICKGCADNRLEFLRRARADGSYGDEEEQLNSFCPLCRTEFSGGKAAQIMNNKFEGGCLPLRLYRNLGSRYLEGRGVETDVERGMEILMLGAEKGDPNCQYALGRTYHVGEYGVPISLEEAKRWLLAATEQGHAIAENNLAVMFKDEGNNAEFLHHLRQSASKGFDKACYNLGRCYYRGIHGPKKSTEEAIRVLTPAAERGHAESMGLLGYVLYKPDPQLPPPLPRDNPNFTKGMHWVRHAAEMGDQQAIKILGSMEEFCSGICFKCEKKANSEKAFLRCSRCRAAWYCSKDCQVQHWKAEERAHKQFCIKWTKREGWMHY